MTPLEREENRKMVAEANEQTKNDKTGTVYRVRGPPGDRKIVAINRTRELHPSGKDGKTVPMRDQEPDVEKMYIVM